MYTPRLFEVHDEKIILDFIESHPFCTVVSQGNDFPQVSHLPLMPSTSSQPLKLIGHLARANSHWKMLDQNNALVIFHGAHGYISPSWYLDPREVPTWNYMVVHVNGFVKIIDDDEWITTCLKQMAASFENKYAESRWGMTGDEDFITAQINGIVGIEIEVKSILAKFKLGQNRSKADQVSMKSHLLNLNTESATELVTMINRLQK